MKLTLFRNKGAPHAIPNSLVPGSICFDRFSLLSRILFEQPLSNGSLPNMNPPSFCFPLAVRMTKVCYLGDYRQFLSARAAKQIERPILPWWVESLGTTSFPELSLLPQHTPSLSFCVAPVRPLLNTQLSGLPSAVQHIFQQHLWKGRVRVPGKGRRWTAGTSRWVMCSMLTICVAEGQIIMLIFFLCLVFMQHLLR